MKENASKDGSIAMHEEGELPYSFHLVLFSEDKLYDLWLPREAEGHFYFSDLREHRFLSIESRENRWVAVCRRPAFFKNVPLSLDSSIVIEDKQLLEIDSEDISCSIYAEKVTQQTVTYKNHPIRPGADVYIGKHPDSDIYCANPYVSIHHAVLSQSEIGWKIRVLESGCRIYVNEEHCESADLQLGDVVVVPGARIIVGRGFLSIAGEISVNHKVLGEPLSLHGGYGHYGERDSLDCVEKYFSRLPRKQLEVEETAIIVEGPPMSMKRANMPLLLRMGGSMVMAGASALAGNFMTLVSSVLFPVLSSKYTDKQRQEYESLRLTKYTEYLEQKRLEILAACQKEHDVLNRKYPPIGEVVAQAQQKQHLWERRINDDDFLHVRLGFGTLPLGAVIDYPPRRFELETDELEEEMYKLVEEKHLVESAPVVLSLLEHTVCGLLGDRELVLQYVLNMVLQLAVSHSYDEVKLVFLATDEELEKLSAVRYLPHTWDDQRKKRYIATTEAEAYTLGEHIKEQIETEEAGNKEVRQLLKARPYYVIFALNKKLAEAHEAIKNLMQSEQNRGASVVAVYDELPKDVQKIITLNKNGKSVCTTMAANGGADTEFETDHCDEGKIASVMKLLANTSLKAVAQAQEMPQMVTFLEMFNTSRIEQLNPLKRWRESNPVKSLAAPVGVSADGSLFMLDLHEKRQGPHGLVAGMTGSGKSEFLITYILSMAVNYHPHEVAFVLIDYKGGGLTGAFENPQTGVRLPHLAGTITNLDGASIQRSLMSIESELIRRQRVLNEVKSIVNEGTMDIYTYQKLHRAGKVSEPMPHLFIISDEFAELKQQQPEFMDKLISAARIGRSLGVHLILATQKPSGVVNDQIRSNTKFRVCLRVQERADSMDMLKRPEAAELTDTGRFYLQVGYNEYFAMGQSAWCGAPYEPQEIPPVQRDDSIDFVDTAGQVISTVKPKVKKDDSGKKQIVAVVEYLANLTTAQGIEQRQLCLPELPKKLDVEDIRRTCSEAERDGVTPVVGMIDDPEKQQQYPLELELQKYHNMLIAGTPGSGKTSFMRTMLYSLTENYSSQQVNYYILDFSGGTLSAFQKAPHCGAFLTENEETDVDRLLDMMKKLVVERKKLFAEAGVTSFEAYTYEKSLPLVLIFIDNFSGFTSMKKGNEYFSTFHEYMKEAPSLGIKYIISCSNLNELSSRSKQELGYRIALQLKDRFVYNEVLNCRGVQIPAALPGRGLCTQNGRVVEYQLAMPFSKASEQERTFLLANRIKQIADERTGCMPARKLPIIREEETYSEFCSDIPEGRIPLGYDMRSVSKVSVPFAQLFCASLYLGNPDGVAEILKSFIFAARKSSMELLVLKRTTGSVFDSHPELLAGYPEVQTLANSETATQQVCERLINEVKARKVFRNEYCEQHGIPLASAKLPVSVKKAGSYIRQKTKPLLILFEDLHEFSCLLKEGYFGVYRDVLQQGRGYNMYFLSCFYPEQKEKLGSDLLAKCFNDDSLMMFFGGQYQNQTLTLLPAEYRKETEPKKEYNRFILRYNNKFYPVVMPCGMISDGEGDPDELPIIQ